MGEVFKVDVEALKGAGSTVAAQATALSSSHRQSMIGLSDSESGWVGSSADALVGMASKWQQIADKHTTAIDNQATHLDTSATFFAHMEEQAAEKMKTVGDQADAVNL
jgi:WXG100 family type VII secretion target